MCDGRLWHVEGPFDRACVYRIVLRAKDSVRDRGLRYVERPRYVASVDGMGIGYAEGMGDGWLRHVERPVNVTRIDRVVCARL